MRHSLMGLGIGAGALAFSFFAQGSHADVEPPSASTTAPTLVPAPDDGTSLPENWKVLAYWTCDASGAGDDSKLKIFVLQDDKPLVQIGINWTPYPNDPYHYHITLTATKPPNTDTDLKKLLAPGSETLKALTDMSEKISQSAIADCLNKSAPRPKGPTQNPTQRLLGQKYQAG